MGMTNDGGGGTVRRTDPHLARLLSEPEVSVELCPGLLVLPVKESAAFIGVLTCENT